MTKKEMFVKAHKMAKEIKAEYPEVNYKFQFALCLTYLQEEGESEMVELKGSEKQIAWAEKIREQMIKDAIAAKKLNEEMVAKRGLNKATELFLNNIAKFMERVESETSAKWYIDNRDNRTIMFNNWK